MRPEPKFKVGDRLIFNKKFKNNCPYWYTILNNKRAKECNFTYIVKSMEWSTLHKGWSYKFIGNSYGWKSIEDYFILNTEYKWLIRRNYAG